MIDQISIAIATKSASVKRIQFIKNQMIYSSKSTTYNVDDTQAHPMTRGSNAALAPQTIEAAKNLGTKPLKTKKKLASIRSLRNGNLLPRKSLKVIAKAASGADKPKTLVCISDNSTDSDASQADQAVRDSRIQAIRKRR